jgi:hypothetical protein
MTYQRKTPRQSPVSFYLGDKEKRLERLAKLDEIAAQFGVNRSVLIQKIADGELVVVRPDDASGETK